MGALTLIQTKKITNFPVILFGSEYWGGMIDWMRATVLAENNIKQEDVDSIHLVDDPAKVDDVLRQAFAHPGPAVVEAVVDPNEPAMPGHVTMDQAWHFVESLVRGEKDRWAILENVVKQQVREVV